MAEYRTIKMSFWTDPFIEGLQPETKLLYLYLFTNPNTNSIGVCNISKRKIAFETGLDAKAVSAGLEFLRKAGKIALDGDYVLLVHFIKHQCFPGPKMIPLFHGLFTQVDSVTVKDELCIRYPDIFGQIYTVSEKHDTLSGGQNPVPIPNQYPIDTVPIPNQYPIDIQKQKQKQKLKNPSKHELNLKPRACACEGGFSRGDDFSDFAESGECAETATAGGKAQCPAAETASPRHQARHNADVPGMEFTELREYYSEHCRPEEPLTGWQEYKALYAARKWPGAAHIYDDLARRIDGEQWSRGYWPSLKKYLAERLWEKPVISRQKRDEWVIPELSCDREKRLKAEAEAEEKAQKDAEKEAEEKERAEREEREERERRIAELEQKEALETSVIAQTEKDRVLPAWRRKLNQRQREAEKAQLENLRKQTENLRKQTAPPPDT